MGIVAILVICVALLVGLITLPTVFDIVGMFDVATDTPLYSIIQLLPYGFLAIVILAAFWFLVNKT